MKAEIEVAKLEEYDEIEFMNFLKKDKILSIFTICDLERFRDKTQVWIAFKKKRITGYILIFSDIIINTHGSPESIKELMRKITLTEPTLVMEPDHLKENERLYEPIEPTDKATEGKITTYHVMKLDLADFKPSTKHNVKRIVKEDLKEILDRFGEEWKTRLEGAIEQGMAYGAYGNSKLASVATVSEIGDEIALIRGVYTLPASRNRGLATSACSALVKELVAKKKTPILWVSKDNLPARKIYARLGFRPTKYKLLGFKGRRITHS
jgi:predicted GNAT family acetyltransferase